MSKNYLIFLRLPFKRAHFREVFMQLTLHQAANTGFLLKRFANLRFDNYENHDIVQGYNVVLIHI